MIHVKVTPEVLSPADCSELTRAPGHGAEVGFVGWVRSVNHGRQVVAVSYDAFIPLAEKVLREICLEAVAKWGPELDLAVEHRVGKLGVGEASVIISAGCRHRDESYLACRYVLEELKQRAPIWKKEHYHDGETAWLKGHALCNHADRGGAGGRPVEPHGH